MNLLKIKCPLYLEVLEEASAHGDLELAGTLQHCVSARVDAYVPVYGDLVVA